MAKWNKIIPKNVQQIRDELHAMKDLSFLYTWTSPHLLLSDFLDFL